MFHEAILLKESVDIDTGGYNDHNIEKPNDSPKLKVELFDDKNVENVPSDEDNRTKIVAEEIGALNLQ